MARSWRGACSASFPCVVMSAAAAPVRPGGRYRRRVKICLLEQGFGGGQTRPVRPPRRHEKLRSAARLPRRWLGGGRSCASPIARRRSSTGQATSQQRLWPPWTPGRAKWWRWAPGWAIEHSKVERREFVQLFLSIVSVSVNPGEVRAIAADTPTHRYTDENCKTET